MFDFRLTIRSPFRRWKEIFCWNSGVFWKTKSFEVDFSSGNDLFNLEIDFRFRGCDHAGTELAFGVLGYELRFRLYDIRHWDYDKSKWESPTYLDEET